MSHILNSARPIPFEEARSLTEEIQIHIRQIPEWTETPQAEAPRALLKVNLLNYLLVLHTMQLQQAPHGADLDYSVMTVIKASTELTDLHTSMLQKGNHMLQQLSHQELRPALSICYLIDKLDPVADRILHHSLKEFAEQVTTAVVQIVSDKALLGAGRNKMWLALVADAFVKIWLRPKQRAVFIQEAVNRVATNTYKVIASQAPSEPKLKGGSAMDGSDVVGTMAHHSAPDTLHVPGLGDDEISALDIDEFSAWTFDEWALESQHLGAFDVSV